MRKFLAVLVVLLIVVAAAATWLFTAGGYSLKGDSARDLQIVAPYEIRHPDASGQTLTLPQADGSSKEYWEPEYGYMIEPAKGTSGEGLAAPMPQHTVTDAQCTSQALGEVAPAPGSWAVPSLNDGSGSYAQGTFTDGFFASGFPSAPAGLRSLESAPLGSDGKPTVLAGHVNMDYPNDRLSSWGLLHYIDPCAHVYITDDQGVVREYQVSTITTVEQNRTESDPELWLDGGGVSVWLLTCAGAHVGDSGAGTTFTFPYTDNLKVGLTPVS